MTGWSVMMRGIRHRSGRSLVVLCSRPSPPRRRCSPRLRPRRAAVGADRRAERGPGQRRRGHRDRRGQRRHRPRRPTEPVGDTQSTVNGRWPRRPHLAAVLDRPVGSVSTDTSLTAGGPRFAARLAWRTRAPARTSDHRRLRHRRRAGLLSERAAAEAGVEVGDKCRCARPRRGAARSYEVVGLYTPLAPDEALLGQQRLLRAGPVRRRGRGPAGRRVRRRRGATCGSATRSGDPAVTYPLRPETVRLDDVGRAARRARHARPGAERVRAAGRDGAAVDRRGRGRGPGRARRTVPIIAVPLVLLAWFVLFLLVAALTEERGPELALARLRGYPQRRHAASDWARHCC